MPDFSLNHVAISVKDVNISAHFYKTVLGLQEIKNRASNSKTRWMSFNDSRELHLIPRPDSIIKTDKAVHFALTTPKLKEFVNHLLALEIDYSDWLGTPNKDYVRQDGIEQIYFQDPDGYWIEINNDI